MLRIAERLFSIDHRSLALFRICLGLILLVNLVLRCLEVPDIYSESGVLPRLASIEHAHPARFSLFWINSSIWFAWLLFAGSAIVAICLTLGIRSRLMAVLSWVLLVSLLNRNQFVHQAGDHLLVVLVFWSMFLPIGVRCSVDAALDERYRKNLNPPLDNGMTDMRVDGSAASQDDRHFSLASVGIILQVVFVYFFTALQKTGPPWTETMDAAYYAVQLEHIATPVGVWLQNFPGLLTLGTWFVIVLEFAVPVLVLSPIFTMPFRIVVLVLLVCMHGVFLTTLRIGLFPFIDYVSLTVLVPSLFWYWCANRSQDKKDTKLTIYYDGDCGFCRKTCLILREFLLPRSVPILKAQDTEAIHKLMDEHNSWVVTDYRGTPRLHWSAVEYLTRQSTLLKPLAWLMRLVPVMSLGNRLYQWVAVNRYRLSRVTEYVLPYREVKLKTGSCHMVLVSAALLVMVFSNLTSITIDKPWFYFNVTKPAHLVTVEKATRLQQNWNMFAPQPPLISAMPVVTGTLRNGQTVDVYHETMMEPSWKIPEPMASIFPSYRWRKHFENVRKNPSDIVRRSYGEYLCRRWNSDTRAETEQLVVLEIWSLRRKTLPGGAPKPESRSRKWIHACKVESSA